MQNYAKSVLQRAAVPMVFVAVGLVLAEVQHGVRFDDPFITYRYALNLASGRGFVFNPGEPTLITTAPLYALVLALVQILGVAPHISSPIIGIGSLVLGAWGLWEFGRERNRLSAFAAGLFFLCAPLAWLTIGFETPAFLAAAIWSLVAADRRWAVAAGLLAAVGIGLRGDGILVAAIAMFVLLLQSRSLKPIAWFFGPIALIYGGLALWLTAQFGSPIPSTLQSKAAQAVSGLTGFYPFTTYPQGALLLLHAWFDQNPAFILWPLLTAAGVVMLIRQAGLKGSTTAWIALAPIAWAGTHAVGYTVLGVAPYVWYYAPLLPGLACAAGFGLGFLTRRRISISISLKLAGVLAVTSAVVIPAHTQAAQVLRGGSPPDPRSLTSKILPETKVDVYEAAGRWIRANTLTTSTLGMSELGVMSYFSDRSTVDFLGLVRPQDAADVRHGDFLAQVLNAMPDYQLLPMRNAVYDVDPQGESWFQLFYRAVHRIDDTRFWGSPLTIWERTAPRPVWTALPNAFPSQRAGQADDLGNGWTISQIEANISDLGALPDGDQPLLIRARLRAGAAVGTRTLRMQPVLLEGGDGLTVVSRLVYTDRWKPGEERWIHFPTLTRRADTAQVYAVEFSWLESPDVRVSPALLPSQPHNCDASPRTTLDLLPMSSRVAVRIDSTSAATAGKIFSGRLLWRAGAPLRATLTTFVHLRNHTGAIVAQADHPTRHQGRLFPTTAWRTNCLYEDNFEVPLPANLPAGNYSLVIGLYDPSTGARLPVDAAPHRTDDGGVRIMTIVIP